MTKECNEISTKHFKKFKGNLEYKAPNNVGSGEGQMYAPLSHRQKGCFHN